MQAIQPRTTSIITMALTHYSYFYLDTCTSVGGCISDEVCLHISQLVHQFEAPVYRDIRVSTQGWVYAASVRSMLPCGSGT